MMQLFIMRKSTAHLVAAALVLLLCAGCQRKNIATNTAVAPLAATDPAYVAEDPVLRKLIGRPGPALDLVTLDGGDIDLASVYGKKPVYLKLWATYCAACRFQMPAFEKAYESFGRRMQFVAVNAGLGDDKAKVLAFRKQHGLQMPVAVDDGSLSGWINLQATPVHLVIGRDGRVVYAGHQDNAALNAALQAALDAPATLSPVMTTTVEKPQVLVPGERVPALLLQSPDRGDLNVKFGGGAPYAVLFTATWCEDYLVQIEPKTVAECRRAREATDHLAQASKAKWLGVVTHLWTTPKDLAAYSRKTKPTFPYAIDTSGTAFHDFGVQRFPAIAIVGGNGRLLRVLSPEDLDQPDAYKKLRLGS